jgi:signal transduction histidine kinase
MISAAVSRAAAAWAVAALCAVLAASTVWIELSWPLTLGGSRFSPWQSVVAVAWAVCGATLLTLRPRTAIGRLLLAVGTLLSATDWGIAYGGHGMRSMPAWFASDWVVQLSAMLWFPALVLQASVLLALYPTQRLPARWWRWPVGAVVGGTALLTVEATFTQDSFDDTGLGSAPLALPAGWWTGAVEAVCLVLIAGGTATIWVATGVRLVRARGPERVQLAWLVTAVVPLVVGVFVLPLPDPVLAVFGLLVPVAVGVGVVRYRMLGIVLRPALTYGLLTAAVVGVYLGATATAGRLLDRGQVPAVLAAGLVAVGLTPVRDRLQHGVERFVYGDRHDPLRAVTRAGGTLAAEGDALSGLLSGVADAVRAPWAAVVAPDGRTVATAVGAAAIGYEPGGFVELPLLLEGRPLGTLRVGDRDPAHPYADDDLRLLRLLAPQLAAVVRAVDLAEALQRERDRVVAATAAERDRLRHDLHDGLGPALAGVGLGLQALVDVLGSAEPGVARPIAERLRQEVGTTVAEVRRIIDDLRPVSLDELGLAAALRRHAEAVGAALDVSVEVGTLPPLDPQTEVAVLRIAQEALTNVVRHAGARTVRMRLASTTDDVPLVVLEVADDGRGLGQGRDGGLGLASMRRRAEALGGQFAVGVRAAGGTTVTARIPVAVTL